MMVSSKIIINQMKNYFIFPTAFSDATNMDVGVPPSSLPDGPEVHCPPSSGSRRQGVREVHAIRPGLRAEALRLSRVEALRQDQDIPG